MGYDTAYGSHAGNMLAKAISLLVVVRKSIENQDIERRKRDAG
jgi:hypothetical protein